MAGSYLFIDMYVDFAYVQVTGGFAPHAQMIMHKIQEITEVVQAVGIHCSPELTAGCASLRKSAVECRMREGQHWR